MRVRHAALLLGALAACGSREAPSVLEPHFDYEPTRAPPAPWSTDDMVAEELVEMDDLAFAAVAEAKPNPAAAARYYAALAVAQRDAAALSLAANGRFAGNLRATTARVTCLHLPDICAIDPGDDPYAQALAEIVSPHVAMRLAHDSRARPRPLPEGDDFWAQKGPFEESEAGSWTTWLVPDATAFRLPPPTTIGSEADIAQIDAVERGSQRTLTDEEKSAIGLWLAGPGTKTAAGVWLEIADDILEQSDADVARRLYVRSVVAMAMADAEIASMDSKYTHWSKRPQMRDPLLRTFMPTPNRPGYPSDSVAVSACAARVLETLVPEAGRDVDRLLAVGSQARIDAGIHYLIDVTAAEDLGARVADAALDHAGVQVVAP
jgi:hypothetical protein